MKQVYIVTTYTGTALSYLIRNISKVKYAHVSISLNEDLRPMYSFGRLNPKTPIFAGLVQENINEGLYAIRINTICRVYSLDVDERSYELMRDKLDYMWQKKKDYSYDVEALVRMPFGLAKLNEKKYVCSSFVAYILESGEVGVFDKPYYEIRPSDFLENSRFNMIYEGLLNKYSTENTYGYSLF